jgi:hypothetical protein
MRCSCQRAGILGGRTRQQKSTRRTGRGHDGAVSIGLEQGLTFDHCDMRIQFFDQGPYTRAAYLLEQSRLGNIPAVFPHARCPVLGATCKKILWKHHAAIA